VVVESRRSGGLGVSRVRRGGQDSVTWRDAAAEMYGADFEHECPLQSMDSETGAAFTSTMAYGVAQILQVFVMVRFPADEILIYGTSLCIVVPFILEILALHHLTPPGKQFWTHAAVIFTVSMRSLSVRMMWSSSQQSSLQS